MNQTQNSTPPPVWARSDLSDPHAAGDKADRVRRMFAAIAPRYDLNNRLHSLWRDQAWRRAAVRAARVQPGEEVLDVACGTGDLTEAFAATGAGRIVGLDFTPEMLDIAERKRRDRLARGGRRARGMDQIEYLRGDAQDLPFDDRTFDVVSIAFGIRNVQDMDLALGQFARVLRPGGRLVILEFERPGTPIVRTFHDFYCGWLMPRTATLISGDNTGAYRYLPRSVGTFCSAEDLRLGVARAGFDPVRSRRLTFGICACTVGVRTG